MDLYFLIKFWEEIILGSVFLLAIIIWFIVAFVQEKKKAKKKKYMESIGYKHSLFSVSSFGNHNTYGFKRDGKCIREKDVYKLSIKEIKNKFK